MYDNASALAMSMGERRMHRLWESKGIAAYVAREAHARRFAERAGYPQSLFAVAAAAPELCDPEARSHWIARIEGLSERDVANVLAAVPGMSEVVRTFCTEVVLRAREELVDVVAR